MDTRSRAVIALQDIISAGAQITLALSAAQPGQRLDTFTDVLDNMQKRLSAANALLSMYPDAQLLFTEGDPFSDTEAREVDELDKALALSIPEQLDGIVEAGVDDGRVIAADIRAALNHKPVKIRWNAQMQRAVVDLRPMLYDLLERADPHGEDAAGYWAEPDEDEDSEPDEETFTFDVDAARRESDEQ